MTVAHPTLSFAPRRDSMSMAHRRHCTALCWLTTLVLCVFCALPSYAALIEQIPEGIRDFSVFRIGDTAPVALVIGGIQGDEPGGFSAATLLATRYHVRKGTVVVVPNLNFASIIHRTRGLFGDMNRKFLQLDKEDPEFRSVSRIQELIRAPEVRLILNLHDGSGYYRSVFIDNLRNPRRWGQSIIIDQALVGGSQGTQPLHELEYIAGEVTTQVNKKLLHPEHALHVHNTRTAQGDNEMEKSLSWYAVRHGKAAFGLEASKEFNVEIRTYYHLAMVEAFLRHAGIVFERDFALNPKGIRTALQSNLSMSFAENRVILPLEDVRPRLNFWPMPRDSYTGIPSKPIMAILGDKNMLSVHYGNRTITRISPDWRDIDHSIDGMEVTVDGHKQMISFGQIVNVRTSFMVHGIEGYRVNAIGAELQVDNESNYPLTRKNFIPRYSIDRQGTLYRVEVYRGNNFSGMFLVRFGSPHSLQTKNQNLPATPRKESSLGY